ncbi:hypothetical protein G4D82_14015 [Flavobacterium sp. CYK-4]|uniref:hypothetical protein n=1 Tax=Flavobacterium lotistagni TaxID=2709660 RepID=UPI00140E1970|nr:hypothetical protein [Flavobacterium lotistagni]NHM08340.1 hypothetical protein [Flavobacterium lotistagni]
MNKEHFKFTTLSLILINVWTLYNFFDYYSSEVKYSTGSMTLFFNFIGSAMIAAGIGIILILTRISLYKSKYRFKLKNNFFYLLAGLFNIQISIIWLISVIMEFLKFELEGLPYMLGNFTVALFIWQ